jgi:hypothetical protein
MTTIQLTIVETLSKFIEKEFNNEPIPAADMLHHHGNGMVLHAFASPLLRERKIVDKLGCILWLRVKYGSNLVDAKIHVESALNHGSPLWNKGFRF